MTSNPKLKNERPSFGKTCKYTLIGFNILFVLMIIDFILTLIRGFVNGNYISGGEIGPTLGIGFIINIVVFVVVVGNLFLGLMVLLTRPKKHPRTH